MVAADTQLKVQMGKCSEGPRTTQGADWFTALDLVTFVNVALLKMIVVGLELPAIQGG